MKLSEINAAFVCAAGWLRPSQGSPLESKRDNTYNGPLPIVNEGMLETGGSVDTTLLSPFVTFNYKGGLRGLQH